MNWVQLRLIVDQDSVTELEEWLFANDSLSVTFQDAEDQPILEPGVGETPLWDKVLMIALFEGVVDTKQIQTGLECSKLWQQIHTSRWEVLEDKEWIRAWMEDYHPMQFGKRLWVCPSWEVAPHPEAVNIFLDPGLAFGTGTHPTTALCLGWLDEQVIPGQHLVDYGCGSGILAVAALKLGAEKVTAIDHEPQAIQATRDNANRNKIAEERLQILLPEQYKPVEADGLVANILAETIRDLAQLLATQVKSEGWIALSGILEYQADLIVNQYSQWFYMNEPVIMGEWVLLSGIRKNNRMESIDLK